MQKTASLERERRLVLTARLSSMGSSGGTTLVRMSVHSRNSLYRFLHRGGEGGQSQQNEQRNLADIFKGTRS